MQEKSMCVVVFLGGAARVRLPPLAIISGNAGWRAQQVQIKHAESADAGRTNRAGDGKTP
jgi:hypothetical protein